MTATIEQQLELEQRGIDAGASQYMDNQRYAEKNGRGDKLDYAQRLMQEFVQPLTDALDADMKRTGPGKLSRARAVLRQVEPAKAVFLALKNIFGSFTFKEMMPVALGLNIGKMVEDELRFTQFKQQNKNYYEEVVADFKRKGTQSYRHMHRVMTHKANEKSQQWEPWDNKLRVDVGLKLVNLVMENTDLIERKDRWDAKTKYTTVLVPTESAIKWVRDHEEIKQFMYPTRLPCIIVPDDWEGLEQGGYYSPLMRQSVPMIKAKFGKRPSRDVDYANLKNSLNRLQHVPWAVNERVLDVIKEVWAKDLQIGLPSSQPVKVPPSPVADMDKDTVLTTEQQEAFTEWKRMATRLYTADKERVSQGFQVSRVLRMASDYLKYEEFYYVWYADSRGRLYSATSGFSPQGPDMAKGCLRLARGKPLGSVGWYWLRVHLANRFGFDKVPYDDRVQWADDQRVAFNAVYNDPLAHRSVWAGADKPYQYLAAIFEYVEASRLSDPCSYVSHLPIGLDGSCNGLQNFSAMLRDAKGGKATNLIPGAKPEDIYGIVAQVTVQKVKARLGVTNVCTTVGDDHYTEHYFAERWLAYGIDRKIAKRPVMTLPYGATRQSCTEYIWEAIVEKNKELFGTMGFRAAMWLMPIMWESIGEVVVAAREAMDWLQKCATVINKTGNAIEWETADGFVVHQAVCKIDTVQIETALAGRFQVRVGSFSDTLDKIKQRLAVAPNFVHSQDATHMRMVINALEKEGIHDFAFIHDDYGTHACDTEIMHRVIREQFIELYQNNCPLTAFKEYNEERLGITLPPVPVRGSLDLAAVLTSLYFFG